MYSILKQLEPFLSWTKRVAAVKMDPFSAATPACVCIYEPGNEMKTKTNIYRQNSWGHEGPAESPESVWLESDHHFNVLAKPLQTCVGGKEVGEAREGRQRAWPGFNEVCTSKFNPFLCACWRREIAFCPWEKAREQMVSFLCPYWRITLSDVKSRSHTIISICHLFRSSDKLEQGRLLLDNNLLAHTWAPARGASMWQQRHLVATAGMTHFAVRLDLMEAGIRFCVRTSQCGGSPQKPATLCLNLWVLAPTDGTDLHSEGGKQIQHMFSNG